MAAQKHLWVRLSRLQGEYLPISALWILVHSLRDVRSIIQSAPFLPDTTPQPSPGSHRCWQWWLWNELPLNEGFSLCLNPSVGSRLQCSQSPSGFVSLYPISRIFTAIVFDLSFSHPSSLSVLSHFSFQTVEKLWALDFSSFFFSKRDMAIQSVFDYLLPRVALCAALSLLRIQGALKNIHLMHCWGINVWI